MPPSQCYPFSEKPPQVPLSSPHQVWIRLQFPGCPSGRPHSISLNLLTVLWLLPTHWDSALRRLHMITPSLSKTCLLWLLSTGSVPPQLACDLSGIACHYPLYKDWAGNMVAFFSCPPSPSINSASLQECDKKSFTTRWAIIWVVTLYRSPLVGQLLDLLPSPKSPCLLAPMFLAASWGLWVSLLYLMAVNVPFSISYLLSFWFPPSLLACPPFTFPRERAYADLQAWASNCWLGSLMGPKVNSLTHPLPTCFSSDSPCHDRETALHPPWCSSQKPGNQPQPFPLLPLMLCYFFSTQTLEIST